MRVIVINNGGVEVNAWSYITTTGCGHFRAHIVNGERQVLGFYLHVLVRASAC
jgi:hypothetical protein